MHAHCPTCDHCTDHHRVAPDLVVCMACHASGEACTAHASPEAFQLLLARIFAQNSHQFHEMGI